jgi:hypothetical protein
MKTILSFKLFTATPVKSKLSSCHALAVVTPIDSFRKQLLLLQTLTKFLPATGDQTFILNNFLVEKSTADAIFILLPAYT